MQDSWRWFPISRSPALRSFSTSAILRLTSAIALSMRVLTFLIWLTVNGLNWSSVMLMLARLSSRPSGSTSSPTGSFFYWVNKTVNDWLVLTVLHVTLQFGKKGRAGKLLESDCSGRKHHNHTSIEFVIAMMWLYHRLTCGKLLSTGLGTEE